MQYELTGGSSLGDPNRPIGDVLRGVNQTFRTADQIEQRRKLPQTEPDKQPLPTLRELATQVDKLQELRAEVTIRKKELRALVIAADTLADEIGVHTSDEIKRARETFETAKINPDLKDPETQYLLAFARKTDREEQEKERKKTSPVRKSERDTALYSKQIYAVEAVKNLALMLHDPLLRPREKMEAVDTSLLQLQGKPRVIQGQKVPKYLPHRLAAEQAVKRALYLIYERVGKPWTTYPSTPEEHEAWEIMIKVAAERNIIEERQHRRVTSQEAQYIRTQVFPHVHPYVIFRYARKEIGEFFASEITQERLDAKWEEARQQRKQQEKLAKIPDAQELTEVPAIFNQNDAFSLVSAIHTHYGALIDCGDPNLNQLFYVQDPSAQTAFLNAIGTLISEYGFEKRGIPRPTDKQLIQGRQRAAEILSELLQSDTSVIAGKNLLENSTPQTLDALQTVLKQLHVMCSGELSSFYMDFLAADVTETTATYGSGKGGNIVQGVTNQKIWRAPGEMVGILKAIARQSGTIEESAQTREPFPEAVETRQIIIASTIQAVEEIVTQANYGNNQRFLLTDVSVIFAELFSDQVLQEAIQNGDIVPDKSGTIRIIGLEDVILVAMMNRYNLNKTDSVAVQTMINNIVHPQQTRRAAEIIQKPQAEQVPQMKIRPLIEQERKDIAELMETKGIQLSTYMHNAIAIVLESDPAIRQIIEKEGLPETEGGLTSEQVIAAIAQRNQEFLTLETVTSPVIVARGIRTPNFKEMMSLQDELAGVLTSREVEKGRISTVEYALPDFLLMATTSYFNTSQSQVKGDSIQKIVSKAGIGFWKFWLYAREVMEGVIAEEKAKV